MQRKTREGPAVQERQQRAESPARWTISWGWFTAPRFGAAGSGGLEYEPLPVRRRKEPA